MRICFQIDDQAGRDYYRLDNGLFWALHSIALDMDAQRTGLQVPLQILLILQHVDTNTSISWRKLGQLIC